MAGHLATSPPFSGLYFLVLEKPLVSTHICLPVSRLAHPSPVNHYHEPHPHHTRCNHHYTHVDIVTTSPRSNWQTNGYTSSTSSSSSILFNYCYSLHNKLTMKIDGRAQKIFNLMHFFVISENKFSLCFLSSLPLSLFLITWFNIFVVFYHVLREVIIFPFRFNANHPSAYPAIFVFRGSRAAVWFVIFGLWVV